MSYELLFTAPSFRRIIWGGDKMKKEFGYELPGSDVGECLAVSQNELADSEIINGSFKGCRLSCLWNEHRELFSDYPGDTFPLLIKIIDAKDDLSIQVHPDDEYAEKYENGQKGKTECWLILSCDPDADIIIGHNAKSKEELRSMITEGRWKDLITPRPIKPGDFFQIDSGTVHAIRKGTLLLETQQNSTLTYRLYDYDRKDKNGKTRELHIEKSLDVIKCPADSATVKRKFIENNNIFVEELVNCTYYRVMRLEVKSEGEVEFCPPFMIFSCLEGSGTACGYPVKKGDFFIAPAGTDKLSFSGEMVLAASVPN